MGQRHNFRALALPGLRLMALHRAAVVLAEEEPFATTLFQIGTHPATLAASVVGASPDPKDTAREFPGSVITYAVDCVNDDAVCRSRFTGYPAQMVHMQGSVWGGTWDDLGLKTTFDCALGGTPGRTDLAADCAFTALFPGDSRGPVTTTTHLSGCAVQWRFVVVSVTAGRDKLPANERPTGTAPRPGAAELDAFLTAELSSMGCPDVTAPSRETTTRPSVFTWTHAQTAPTTTAPSTAPVTAAPSSSTPPLESTSTATTTSFGARRAGPGRAATASAAITAAAVLAALCFGGSVP
ncbi:hypothetical protein B0T24DRAFT_686737 [Lasiosphaeria ovina]|uniref:Uncharacterized protein n=1 Tax=Lasiosphaeria ovina TaxID=92902 RepID=A0AAE0NJI8_9PEZI|nr:hypothetical protein B0T24DRAFT_686737 [Lasiosphaeria ovina]